MERVSLSQAAHWKKKQAYYRTSRGEVRRVVTIERKRPNWRLVLEDGRDFLVDPSTMLLSE